MAHPSAAEGSDATRGGSGFRACSSTNFCDYEFYRHKSEAGFHGVFSGFGVEGVAVSGIGFAVYIWVQEMWLQCSSE